MKRYELVEVIVTAGASGGNKILIGDIEDLRNDNTQDIIIQGIEFFTVESMPLAPSGNPVLTTAQLQNLFLTLYISDEESIENLPCIRLNNMFESLATGTMQQQFERTRLENLVVSWFKSFFFLATPFATGTTFSIVFGVTYKKLAPGAWAQINANAIPGM
jgi:hypothetical protein